MHGAFWLTQVDWHVLRDALPPRGYVRVSIAPRAHRAKIGGGAMRRKGNAKETQRRRSGDAEETLRTSTLPIGRGSITTIARARGRAEPARFPGSAASLPKERHGRKSCLPHCVRTVASVRG